MNWQFLELTNQDLHAYLEQSSIPEGRTYLQPELLLYAKALFAYLVSDLNALQKSLQTLQKDHSNHFLCELAEIRFDLRSANYQKYQNTQPQMSVVTTQPIALAGEYFFVWGLINEKLHKYQQMSECFAQAAVLFEKAILYKKSLKALHNQASALSNLEPSPSFIQVYQNLIEKALASEDKDILRMSHYNVSVHFFKMGAYKNALKFINEALSLKPLLEMNRDEYLCLLQYCKTKSQLNDFKSFSDELERCLHAPFPDIRNAAEIISNMLTDRTLQPSELPTSWSETSEKKNSLTDAESKLIDLLTAQSQSKDELIRSLFGELIDRDSAINRLNNLLSRLRKKTNLKIESRMGRYYVHFN